MTIPFRMPMQEEPSGHSPVAPGSLADTLLEEIKRLPTLRYGIGKDGNTPLLTDQDITDAYPEMGAAGFDALHEYDVAKKSMALGVDDGNEIAPMMSSPALWDRPAGMPGQQEMADEELMEQMGGPGFPPVEGPPQPLPAFDMRRPTGMMSSPSMGGRRRPRSAY